MDDLTDFFGGGTTGETPAELDVLNPVPKEVQASAKVNNLDWLDIDEQAAREVDQLPKQNLDFAPELAAQWNHENKHPLAYFVPNRDMAGYPVDPKSPRAPNTMGDLSQHHGDPMRLEPEAQMVRMARLMLVESSDLGRWREKMFSKFSKQELAAGKTALSSVLAERGLLGGYYINSDDFPKCANSKAAQEFVRRHASQALFVQAKTACGDCTHNQGGHCGAFQKMLVPEVPYTDDLASKVAKSQGARGFTASSEGDPKARIQSAFLNETGKQAGFSGQSNKGAVIPASRLLRKSSDVAAEQEHVKKAKAEPVVAMVRRELLKGRTAEDIVKVMRLAFDQKALRATQQYWAPLFKEAGLYGTVYSTQESFSDCQEGADFLSKHASQVRAIVAGEKCGSCIFNQVGSCMMYGRKLVASVDDVYTPETVSAVLDEHKIAGKIAAPLIKQDWGKTPRDALLNISKAASSGAPVYRVQSRMGAQGGYYGVSSTHTAKALTKQEIVKVARQYLNEGLYGQSLGQALLARFESRDLAATAPELREVFAEQGLQGIFYVDPTAYDDYGHGCKTAERQHRSRSAVQYAKAGDKCGSCVHQTMPGHCSVLNKKLAREIPYTDRKAQQKAILASGEATQMNLETLVSASSQNVVQEFQLSGGTGQIDLNPEATSVDASIQFGNNDVDVSKL